MAAAALLAALGVAKLVLLLAVGLEAPFGVAYVLYLDLVVVAPVAGLALALGGWSRRRWRLVGACLVALAPVGAYASFVEPSRLVLERAEVGLPDARAGQRPVTIGVLADLQFREVGDQQRQAVEACWPSAPT